LSLAAQFHQENRSERGAPHLGRVELATVHRGALYEPLACVLDSSAIGQVQASLDNELPWMHAAEQRSADLPTSRV
jgi:hypothetical protein